MSKPGKRSFSIDQCGVVALLVAGVLPDLCHAQAVVEVPAPTETVAPTDTRTRFVQPVVSTGLTATSNSGYTNATAAQSDVIVNVSPGLLVRSNGPRLRVNGQFYLDAISYLNGSQRDVVLPRGTLDSNSTLIDQWLFFDASVAAFQTSQTPFGASSLSPSSYNTATTTQARLNPYIQRELAPHLLLNAHAENTWLHTRNDSNVPGNPRDNSHVQDQFVSIERQPVPLGAELQVRRQDTRYSNQDASAQTIDKWRAIVSYAFFDQLALGVVGGQERNQWLIPAGLAGSTVDQRYRVTDAVYGVQAKWRPDERTRFDTTIEHRFFGTGWDADFEHRSGFQTWSAHLVRQASTYQGTPPTNAAAATLPPVPDPLSLPLGDPRRDNLLSYAPVAQLEQSASLGYTLTYPRDAYELAYYFQKLSPLPLPDTPTAQQALLAPANSQTGVALQIRHRLTRLATLSALGRWSRVTGQGGSQDLSSREKVYRVALSWMLAPQSTGTVGLRWQQHRSNVAANAEESALFMGLDHRF